MANLWTRVTKRLLPLVVWEKPRGPTWHLTPRHSLTLERIRDHRLTWTSNKIRNPSLNIRLPLLRALMGNLSIRLEVRPLTNSSDSRLCNLLQAGSIIKWALGRIQDLPSMLLVLQINLINSNNNTLHLNNTLLSLNNTNLLLSRMRAIANSPVARSKPPINRISIKR